MNAHTQQGHKIKQEIIQNTTLIATVPSWAAIWNVEDTNLIKSNSIISEKKKTDLTNQDIITCAL